MLSLRGSDESGRTVADTAGKIWVQADGLQPLGEAFLVILERDRRRLLRLCAALEKLADGLPRSCISGRATRLLSFLNRAYDRHIFLHEKCLFPLVRSIAGPKVAIASILAHLEYEHASDHGSVHEIESAFLNRSCGQPGVDICVLGFSLRSFFENCRRHLAWEANVLQPIVHDLLADGTAAAHHGALLRMSLGLSG